MKEFWKSYFRSIGRAFSLFSCVLGWHDFRYLEVEHNGTSNGGRTKHKVMIEERHCEICFHKEIKTYWGWESFL